MTSRVSMIRQAPPNEALKLTKHRDGQGDAVLCSLAPVLDGRVQLEAR